jgi:adenine-specific DNA-methyltransferase
MPPGRHNGRMQPITGERALVRAALALGAREVAGWSAAEQRLAEWAAGRDGCPAAAGDGGGDVVDVRELRGRIRAGLDPLGAAFCGLRPPRERRPVGQTFTPPAVVASMVRWAARADVPARVIDPGAGSGRFLTAAGRHWPAAALVGVETDPLAALVARANLAAAGLAERAEVLVTDYRTVTLGAATGPTLFIGNPPYVRHHQITSTWKAWFRATAADRGLPASGLAGLHAHFLLATALHAVPGDAGVLVTAAEWLDVGYGRLIRSLFLGPLGGESLHLLDSSVAVFDDAAATAVIACFRPGARPATVRLRRVADLAHLGDLTEGGQVPVYVLRAAERWGALLARPEPGSQQAGSAPLGGPGHGGGPAAGGPPGGATTVRRGGGSGRGGHPVGQVELGELCRVHRGQVTGANRVWIVAADDPRLPGRFLFPAVSRARELFGAGPVLASVAGLRCCVDLPSDLSGLTGPEAAAVERFLAVARGAGAADTYIARHRTPWWRVGLREPAPILATYMARRPPAFVRNLAGARHVNIAHGLYPRAPLPPAALDGLAAFLCRSVTLAQGRTYAGGLTKFEPGEMERLLVPEPALLPGHAGEAGRPGQRGRAANAPAGQIQPLDHIRDSQSPYGMA